MVNECKYGMIHLDKGLVVVTKTIQLVSSFEPTNLCKELGLEPIG